MPGKQIRVNKVPPDTILYHYTKSRGVNGIINNNCFWATKSDFLNDPNEFLYIRDIIFEVFQERINDNGLIDMFLNDAMEENVFSEGGVNREFFILSFSCCRDSITLWSEFGSTIGYNLGLDSGEIIKRIAGKNDIEYHGLVIYDKKKQKKIIDRLISRDIPRALNADMKDILLEGRRNREAHIYQKACRKFQKITANYAMFFKHEAFSQEKEYRFVFRRSSDMKVFFREKDGFIIPYMEIHLDDKKLPLKEIMVAPQNYIDLAKKGLDYLIKYKGYDVPVKLSDIKLRY